MSELHSFGITINKRKNRKKLIESSRQKKRNQAKELMSTSESDLGTSEYDSAGTGVDVPSQENLLMLFRLNFPNRNRGPKREYNVHSETHMDK